jgi:hypothetical protein
MCGKEDQRIPAAIGGGARKVYKTGKTGRFTETDGVRFRLTTGFFF